MAIENRTRDEIYRSERAKFADAWKRLTPILDNPAAHMRDRMNAYLELARVGRTSYQRGDEIPNISQLARFLGKADTTVANMITAKNHNRDASEIIMNLAAIYPPPAPGQSAYAARVERLAAAEHWYKRDRRGSLRDVLNRAAAIEMAG